VDLHQFSDWLSSTSISQAIQITSWAIPGIQTVHLVSLALLFAAPLNLLAGRFIRAIWLLLLLLLISGTLLITAEPGRTITNPVFYVKMTMLAVVIVITLWLSAVSRRELERPGAIHKVAAALSMVLWIGIIFAGRFIAYVESY
jgi:hypothetical protein